MSGDGKLNTGTIPYQLTEKEAKLIEWCRTCGYGEGMIHLENGQPVRIEEIKKSIKL